MLSAIGRPWLVSFLTYAEDFRQIWILLGEISEVFETWEIFDQVEL
jgi:hypothetical protein